MLFLIPLKGTSERKNVRGWKSLKWYNTVDTKFLYKLHFLLKIIIPRFKCKETLLIGKLITFFFFITSF